MTALAEYEWIASKPAPPPSPIGQPRPAPSGPRPQPTHPSPAGPPKNQYEWTRHPMTAAARTDMRVADACGEAVTFPAVRAAAAGPGRTARGRVPVSLISSSGGAADWGRHPARIGHAADVRLAAHGTEDPVPREAAAAPVAVADVTLPPGVPAEGSGRRAGAPTWLRSARRWALAWSLVLVVVCAWVSAAAGHAGAIAPLALAVLFSWQWLAATPKLLWPRGGA